MMALALQWPLQRPLQLKVRPPAATAVHHRRRHRLLPVRRSPLLRARCCASAAAAADSEKAQAAARRAYPFDEVEPRWQRHWEEHRTFRTPDIGEGLDTSKPKCYILDMFPYPRQGALYPFTICTDRICVLQSFKFTTVLLALIPCLCHYAVPVFLS